MKKEDLIKESLITLAEFYQTRLSENVLNMYTSILTDYPLEILTPAFSAILRDSTITRMPLPSAILEKAGLTEVSSDQKARLIIANIKKCISKHGWNNSDRAREELGEDAWEAVKRSGGWQNLCETLNYDNEQIFMAQLRELTKAVLDESKREQAKDSIRIAADLLKDIKKLN